MASLKRIAQAFAGIGLHPNRARSMAEMAQGNPALAAKIAEAVSLGDDAALRRIAADAQWSVAPAAPPPQAPATPRLEPPGKPSVEAQRQRIEAEQAAQAPVPPDQTYPTPDFEMDLPPSRAGDTTFGDVPDPARAGMSESQDVGMGSPTSGPPAAWASDPSAPGFTPQPIDNLIDRLGDSPAMPMETRPAGAPMGAWQAGENIPGAGSMDNLLAEIDARRATQPPPPSDMPRMEDAAPPPRGTPTPQAPEGPRARSTPEAPGRKPRMPRGDMAKLGVAGGVIGAGIGGLLSPTEMLLDPLTYTPALPFVAAKALLPNSQSQPAGGAPPTAAPVPNIIRPPQPMSTADLAAQTRPPPSVTTPQSPRDQAMKMIDDLNARRRAAGGEVPDAPQTMQKVNRLLAMSNEQSAAASRGDIPVQGNGPREQAQRILAQLNAMRQQAGGEVPQAGQMMAEVRRLQAMADKQTNARRAG